MRILRLIALVTVLATRFPASVAEAQPVIDDFETGSFHMVGVAGAFISSSYAVSSPAHALAPVREVGLQSFIVGGLPTMADLDAWTRVDDELLVTFPPGGGVAYLNYELPAPVDLTAGGLNDRIEVAFSAVTTGGNVQLSIWDAVGGQGGQLHAPTQNLNVFRFADLGTGLDLTQVTRVQVMFNAGTPSGFELRDIRAARRDAIWAKFDLVEETLFGPPYPLAPFSYLVTDQGPSDRQRVQLLSAARLASGAASGIALTGMDSGGDAESGFAGALQAVWNEPGQAFASTGFDFKVDIAALSGVDPEPFLPALPSIVTTPTGFELSFEVRFLGKGGEVMRTSHRQMAFDTHPGQDLQLGNVRVHALAGAAGREGTAPVVDQAGGGEAGFRVTFDARSTGDVDPAVPLLEATLTGDFRAVQATGVGPGVGGRGQALEAWPSVTRAGVRLRLAQPVAVGGRVELFDVSGRRVRSLAIAGGERECVWDGRETSGHPAAAGLYLARFTDGWQELRARVVRIP